MLFTRSKNSIEVIFEKLKILGWPLVYIETKVCTITLEKIFAEVGIVFKLMCLRVEIIIFVLLIDTLKVCIIRNFWFMNPNS